MTVTTKKHTERKLALRNFFRARCRKIRWFAHSLKLFASTRHPRGSPHGNSSRISDGLRSRLNAESAAFRIGFTMVSGWLAMRKLVAIDLRQTQQGLVTGGPALPTWISCLQSGSFGYHVIVLLQHAEHGLEAFSINARKQSGTTSLAKKHVIVFGESQLSFQRGHSPKFLKRNVTTILQGSWH